MATPRDGFSVADQEQLAKSAGNKCSAPFCRAPTSGPSSSRASGVSNVGVAAHISGARPGAARYNRNLSSAQRRHRDNAIWLCQTHANMIDDDEVRFTPQLLGAWRQAAEQRAADELGRPVLQQGESRMLVPHRTVMDPTVGSIGHRVDEFLTDIGGPIAWSDDYHRVRMSLYEIALNAVTHGGAMTVTMESEREAVHLSDSGRPFGKARLLEGGRGGNRAVTDFDEQTRGTFLLTYRRVDELNIWSVIDEVLTEGADVPCRVVIQGTGQTAGEQALADLRALGGCDEVHFYASRLASYSDIYIIADKVRAELAGRRMFIHGIPASSPLRTVIAEQLPMTVVGE